MTSAFNGSRNIRLTHVRPSRVCECVCVCVLEPLSFVIACLDTQSGAANYVRVARLIRVTLHTSADSDGRPSAWVVLQTDDIE